MTYEKAVKTIHSLLRFGIKPGLDRIKKLMSYMGNPQNGMKFVHVAGTSGKGSTSNMVASVLSSAHLKTGLFTSPFVVDFRERIQIDGRMIPQNALARITEALMPHVDSMARNGEIITEFELITAIAFVWFFEQKCDVVVLETGLGGRFDATNVIKSPIVSVITAISLDHTDILGDTVRKIAAEKCGIIKRSSVTVTYSEQHPDALPVIMETCAAMNNRLVIPNFSSVRITSSSLSGTDFYYGGMELSLSLVGEHQVKNSITAIEAAKLCFEKLNVKPKTAHFKRGLSAVRLPARIEVLSHSPIVILDGGHNPEKIGMLAKLLKQHVKAKCITGIIGMLRDKDVESSVSLIAPLLSRVYVAEIDNERALSSEAFADLLRKYCKVDILDNSAEKIILNLSDNDALVVCGSLYLCGQLRQKLINGIIKRQNHD